ncbi:surfeit locus protein 1-like [Mya arenaria]|uniref:surfeit locus protein 1-like n=1 Tax=Mya arenaria TaxID=6604 RepID=UPI0022E1EE9E|nr:surfeit locus protein 1-like [Mya arenaria]
MFRHVMQPLVCKSDKVSIPFCKVAKRLLPWKPSLSRSEWVVLRRLYCQKPRKVPDFQEVTFKSGRYYFLALPALSLYLCYWQIQRKQWKENLIEKLKSRFNTPPVPLPDDLEELNHPDMEFKPIKVRGQFDYTREVYLGPRTEFSASQIQPMAQERTSGVHVITPFKVDGRDLTILVNRGWLIQGQFQSEEGRKKGQVNTTVELIGQVRHDQVTTNVAYMMMGDFKKPTMQQGQKVYLVRDLNQLAETCGTSPVLLDYVAGELPINGPKIVTPTIELRNTHLEYAGFWFCGAVVTFMFWAKYMRKPPEGITTFRSKIKSYK